MYHAKVGAIQEQYRVSGDAALDLLHSGTSPIGTPLEILVPGPVAIDARLGVIFLKNARGQVHRLPNTYRRKAMDRNTMNETFKAHGLKWRKAESLFGWDVPKDLNPQDWLLINADESIIALGDGPTRKNFENKPTLEEFNERAAKIGLHPGDERYEEAKASVVDIEMNYPAPEAVFEKLQNGEPLDRISPQRTSDEDLEKMGRLMGEGRLSS